MLTFTEKMTINRLATNIITKSFGNVRSVIYHIRLAERLLRPQQLKLLKEIVVKHLTIQEDRRSSAHG